MEVDYFKGCSDERTCKLRYKTLVKKHHPDAGGDTRVMQEVNAQYERLEKNGWRNYRDAQRDYFGKTSTGKSSSAFYQDFDFGDIFEEMQRQEERRREHTRKKEEERRREYAKAQEMKRFEVHTEWEEVKARLGTLSTDEIILEFEAVWKRVKYKERGL